MKRHTINYYNKRKQQWTWDNITKRCYEDFAEKELSWYENRKDYIETILNQNGIMEPDFVLIDYIFNEVFNEECIQHENELKSGLLKYFKTDMEEEKILSKCKEVPSFKQWFDEQDYTENFRERIEDIFNIKIA